MYVGRSGCGTLALSVLLLLLYAFRRILRDAALDRLNGTSVGGGVSDCGEAMVLLVLASCADGGSGASFKSMITGGRRVRRM